MTPLFCDTAHPIYISEEDHLTPATARQILTHNLTGAALCHWQKTTSE
ncbi:hypothetical protein MWH03_00075 [Klebsiella pneumoniae]|nr:hypothetical protein [Klebsiella pneumoniae]